MKNTDYLSMWDICSEMTTLFFRAKPEQCVSLILYFLIPNVAYGISYPLYPGFDVETVTGISLCSLQWD